MKKIFIIHYSLFTILIAFALSSCRPQSDNLLSYGDNDYQAYARADNSYVDEFKAFWTAMNENYCIWDVEAEHGLDWDEVYTTYLPQFQEFDDRSKAVSNQELKALYSSFTDSLHDGHLLLQIKNLDNGQYISLRPNESRIARERGEQANNESNNITTLDQYLTSSVAAEYRIVEYDGVSASELVIEVVDSMSRLIIEKVDAYQALVNANGGPNATNDSIYLAAGELKAYAEQFISMIENYPPTTLEGMTDWFVSYFNLLYYFYYYVGLQVGVELMPMDWSIADDMLGFIRFARFEGDILYLRLGGFGLTPHLAYGYATNDKSSLYYAYQKAVKRIWKRWFNSIQDLHQDGSLGGIIIDVRNNGGGYVNDYKYVLGALLPIGGWESHMLRTKNGIGRLDYNPMVPFVVPTYPEPHAVIKEEPIVVLANSQSVSMSENTTWGVKSQPNGCFIGTRTYGGLSALNTSPEDYSATYSGAFGIQYETPIWGYVPKYVCLYPNEKGEWRTVEGIGFEPDIETPLNVVLWRTQKRDNQLETALDYIHNHK